jgi:anti-sigma factor RsiW
MTRDDARIALGAYVVGALDPAERAEVERWLADDADLREELAELAALPGLLGRLDRHEAVGHGGLDLADGPDPALADRIVAAAAEQRRAERRAERRSVRRWQAVAALAALATLVLGTLAVVAAVRDDGPSRAADTRPPAVEVAAVSAAAQASGLWGTVRAQPKGWGTELEVQLWDMPPEPSFALVAVGMDGRREQAGAWSLTTNRDCLVTGATSIRRGDLQRIEVVTPSGVLATAALV